MIKRIYHFLNPIDHLGDKQYSIFYPLIATFALYGISELYVYYIARNPLAVGGYIIEGALALVAYFAFRSGIRGGIITSVLTVGYFFYIIYSRHYSGNLLVSGIETTLVLGSVYIIIGILVGWLKQTIDTLIERETDEKRRLQAILQQLPVGVLITDKKGNITQGNKQIEMILGRKMRQGLVAGIDNLESATEQRAELSPTDWPLVQSLKTGKSIIGRDISIIRDDGKPAHLQVSSSVIRNKNGQVIAAASIINDVTQQKELEERKDDFVNMASHELKTPITSMKLYIDSLLIKLKKYDDPNAVKTLTNIKHQTERLQELVSDLLDVSRLQTGKLKFTKELFRLDELVHETIDVLHGATKNQEILVMNKLPVKVYGDKFRIYQVLTNLVTNAIKYSPENTKIIIRVKREDGKAIVSVQDSGIGIAKDQHKKIFDRLYQVTDPEVKTFPGLGMGLYISKEIIKRHKGNIWVESEKGKGATFYFSLPLHKQ